MMSILSLLLKIGVVGSLLATISAAPAYNGPRDYTQPDGSVVELCLHGDENYHYYATCPANADDILNELDTTSLVDLSTKDDDDGGDYTVLRDDNGYLVFADEDGSGDLVSSGYIVGVADVTKLRIPKRLHRRGRRANKDKPLLARKRAPDGCSYNFGSYLRRGPRGRQDRGHGRKLWYEEAIPDCIANGTPSNPCTLQHLVVRVRFSDHASRSLAPDSDYEALFNGGTHGSLDHFFFNQSSGALLVNTTITPWIDVNQTELYAVIDSATVPSNNNQALQTWAEALTKLETDYSFNFDEFDADGDGFIDSLTILHSGMGYEDGGMDCEGVPADERMWSHQTSSYFFTSATSFPVIKNGAFSVVGGAVKGSCTSSYLPTRLGVAAHELAHQWGLPDMKYSAGGFDLMGYMWGFRNNQENVPLGAVSKYFLGWGNVVDIDTSADFSLLPSCWDNTIYKIDGQGMPEGEFFLLENRQPCGYDVYMKHQSKSPFRDKTGVAIWHVDLSGILPVYQDSSDWHVLRIDDHVDSADLFPYYGLSSSYGLEFPKRHSMVHLLQGDGISDIEKDNGDIGDRHDMFRYSTRYGWTGNAGYEINDDGTMRNNDRNNGAASQPWPTMQSYAFGYFANTGISLVFGNTTEETDSNGDLVAVPAPIDVTVTLSPVPQVTAMPSDIPSSKPTSSPSDAPSTSPSKDPSDIPSNSPSSEPTLSLEPTNAPSARPTVSIQPTLSPSNQPTLSQAPSDSPTSSPTLSIAPSPSPSGKPSLSVAPSPSPSDEPTVSIEPTNTPTSATVSSSWTQITYDDFEGNSWGDWIDGGSDAHLASGISSSVNAQHIHQGDYAARIRGKWSYSVITSVPFDASIYSELRVSFWYAGRSMESGEDFMLEYWDGSSSTAWVTIETWAAGVHFSNGVFYNPTITITPSANVVFTGQAEIRFRCSASGTKDWVYIDEILLEGLS